MSINIRHALHIQTPCPECEHGALKIERDFERGVCDACYMLNHGGLRKEREQRPARMARFAASFPLVAGTGEQPFRTEADGYGEGIIDDD